MDFDDSGQGPPIRVPPSDATDPGTLRFSLEYRGHQFELNAGVLNLGRSASCQLVLDDALVSRRHAAVNVGRDSVTLNDLSSANGVFVNGERVTGARVLKPGDRILIGKQELIFRTMLRSEAVPESTAQRFNAETLHGLDVTALRSAPRTAGVIGTSRPPLTVDTEPGEASEATHQGDALELLGGVADKVLALGRGEEAERILTNYLQNLRDAARAGDHPDARHAERAVHYAVKLAQGTGKARWVDYTFDLYRILQRPLPTATVDQLYSVLRNVAGVSLAGLREYVAALRSVQQRLGPAERFLVQRIEGLERLAALK